MKNSMRRQFSQTKKLTHICSKWNVKPHLSKILETLQSTHIYLKSQRVGGVNQSFNLKQRERDNHQINHQSTQVRCNNERERCNVYDKHATMHPTHFHGEKVKMFRKIPSMLIDDTAFSFIFFSQVQQKCFPF